MTCAHLIAAALLVGTSFSCVPSTQAPPRCPAPTQPHPTAATPAQARTPLESEPPLLPPESNPLPTLQALASLNVLRIESTSDGGLDKRAIVIREETTDALILEIIGKGATEGDPSSLRYQALVELPPDEATRISELQWKSGELPAHHVLWFVVENSGRARQRCQVAPPHPFSADNANTTEQRQTLKPACARR